MNEQNINTLYDARQDYMRDNAEIDMKYGTAPRERRVAITYAAVTVICFFFARVYNTLSHGVYSASMTYLFAVPFLLGWLPALMTWLLPPVRRGGTVCRNAWHSGVAAMTMSSLLRGIFEIAGTASPLQSGLMGAGIAMLIIGAIAYIIDK